MDRTKAGSAGIPKFKLLDLPTSSTKAGWHSIEALIACPQKYKFSKVLGVQARSTGYPSHFAKGSLIHAARAQYLHDGRDPRSPWLAQMKKCKADMEKDSGLVVSQQDFHRARLDFEGWMEFWKVRPVTQVLAVEYEIQPRGLKPGAPAWAHRTARLDSIEKHQGKIWIGECKSTVSGEKRVGDIYALHGQVLLACSLWGEEETEKFGPLAGVLLDVVQKGSGTKKGKGFAPRIAIPIDRLAFALKWFRDNFHVWVMQSQMIGWNDKVERRVTSCIDTFGPCTYRDLCMKGRAGALPYVIGPEKIPLVNWKPSAGQEMAPWA